jgi:ABC-type uncharacterized transport system auxiliary subunit
MNQPSRPIVSLAATALLLAVFTLVGTGCLSRPALVRQTFALASPAPSTLTTNRGEGVLALRSCAVSPLFESRAFVYRTGGEAYEQDPYAGFMVSPNNALAIPIRGYLRDAGVFRDVVEPGSLVQPDRLLEVYVSELYGDLRTPGKPAAVLAAQFVFFRSGSGTSPAVFLDKTYSRRIPLKENTAVSVVAGWNQALAEIMAEVATDLAAKH